MKKTIPLFLLALLSIAGCTKDSNNNNHNTNITDSKYIEFTIDGATYKYEEYNGDPVRDANNDQELPSVICGSTAFTIGGSTTGGRNAFTLNFPYAVNGVGTFVTPTIDFSNSTLPDTVFSGIFWPDGSVAQQYNEDFITRAMNGGSCNKVTQKLTPQTLSITSWEPLGPIPVVVNAEGTFSGTLYDNVQGQANCSASAAHPYSGKFKYFHH